MIGNFRRSRAIGCAIASALIVCYGLATAPAAPADALGSQFRVSFQGNDGNTAYNAQFPDLAYDPTTHQHLIVFLNSSNGTTTVSGQFVDASGNLVGSNFAISPTGVSNKPPAVAYDATDDRFLVVWYNTTGQLIQGQLVGSSGTLVGSTIAVSSVASYNDIETVDLAWSPDAGEFLVAWKALSKGQIFGRRISDAGVPLGASDLQISNITAGTTTGADDAMATAYNTHDHQFLVAWRGQDSVQAPNHEYEIWGQLVGTDGTDVGPSDFRISHVGSDMDSHYQRAARPNIAYDPIRDRFLVTFTTDTSSAAGAYETFGQFVGANASMIGATFQISNFGNGAADSGVVGNDVTYDPATDLYTVVYAGAPSGVTAEPPETAEIYGDYLSGDGVALGTRDFPISDMGSSTNPLLGGFRPAIDTDTTTHRFMTAWQGDTTQGSLVDNQSEVWGRTASGSGFQPVVTTGPATGLTLSGATLNGTINPQGHASTYHFEYGKTTSYGSSSSTQSVGATPGNDAVSAAITGLQAGQTYHFRLVASTPVGTIPGADQTFTVPTATLVFVGRVKAKSKGVTFSVVCRSVTGAACLGLGQVTTLEHLVGKQVVAVTAASKRHHKKRVVIGSKKFPVSAGGMVKITVRLNATGRRLLKSFGRVPTTVIVTTLNTSPHPMVKRKVTIKQKHH